MDKIMTCLYSVSHTNSTFTRHNFASINDK